MTNVKQSKQEAIQTLLTEFENYLSVLDVVTDTDSYYSSTDVVFVSDQVLEFECQSEEILQGMQLGERNFKDPEMATRLNSVPLENIERVTQLLVELIERFKNTETYQHHTASPNPSI